MRFYTKKELLEKRDERSLLDYSFYKDYLREDGIENLAKATQLTINQVIESDCLEIYFIENYKELKRTIEEYLWINLDNNCIEVEKREFEKAKKLIFEALYLSPEDEKELIEKRRLNKAIKLINKEGRIWFDSAGVEIEVEKSFQYNTYNIRENSEIKYGIHLNELKSILKSYIEFLKIDKKQHPNLSL